MSETAEVQVRDTEVSAGGSPRGGALMHVALLLAPEEAQGTREAVPPKPRTGRRYDPVALCDAVLELQASGVKQVTLSAFGELSYWACRAAPSEARRFTDFVAYATPCFAAAGIRVDALGDVDELPSSLRQRLDYLLDATRSGAGMELTLLVSYAGRADVVETARHLAALVHAGLLIPDDIDEQLFRARMQAAHVSDFDLCICSEGAIPAHDLFPFQGSRAASVEITADAGRLRGELARVLDESWERGSGSTQLGVEGAECDDPSRERASQSESDGRERARRAPAASATRLREGGLCGGLVSSNGRGS